MFERKSERVEFLASDSVKQMPIYDLSKTGVSCYYSEIKEKNSFVVVKINDLLLRAKVIYCKKREKDYRLGLQFWNILPERQIKLNELVEKYSKGVPINCTIVEDKSRGRSENSPQETKRIVTKDSANRRLKKNG